MPRLLCAVDPEGRSLLTRTYGGVALPSFPTVALLASVAAYADAAGTGALRRVSCDDGFQIAYRRSRGGVLWVLASGNGEDDATVDATLLMCERIAEGICGREALNCHSAARERGGAQRMKMALGACVAAVDRAMDERAPPPFAPLGVRRDRPAASLEGRRDPSAGDFLEGVMSALPNVDRVAMMYPTTNATDDVEYAATSPGWNAMDEADALVVNAVLTSTPPGPCARDTPVYVDGGRTPARLLTASAGGIEAEGIAGRVAVAVVTGPSPTLEVFRAVAKLTNSKLSYR